MAIGPNSDPELKTGHPRNQRTATLGGAVVFVSAIAIIVLGYLSYRLYQDASVLRSSPHDNVQWSLSRLEVETYKLQAALSDPSVDLIEVRKRYDIFYSRVALIRGGDLFGALRRDVEGGNELSRFTQFLEHTTPVIDGPDGDLETQRKDLWIQLRGLSGAAAALSLRGNALFSEQASARGDALAKHTIRAAVIAMALITLLVTSLIVLLSRSRLVERTQRLAAANDARLAAIAGVALDPIIISDAQGRVIEYNDAAEFVFGFHRAEALGKKMSDLFIPDDMQEAHETGMKRYLREGKGQVVGKGRLELSAVRRSGERFPVELAVAEAREAEGREPIFVGFMRDISQRKAAEADLMEARDAAMAADRAKSHFIALMSHEMRTPLNGVMGMLDILDGTHLSEEQKEYVDVAIRSGEILLRHVSDVLDISRMEAGYLEVATEPVNIDAILNEVVDVARPRALAAKTEIVIENAVRALPYVGDAHRIEQVMLNLVGNASKFTSRGRILVQTTLINSTDIADEIEFSVLDNGLGIAEADHERVFDEFVTLDSGYDRKVDGTGLGLSICRRVVKVMGGTIGVESRLGGGSRFWFRLHLKRGSQVASEPAPSVAHMVDRSSLPALNVLLVEDNDVNRLVACNMLTKAGHHVVEASDGLEGVECATAQRFDIILMDISMPRLDGIEATKRICASGASESTPIIALTAHVSPSEQAKFREAGMVDCLTKPLRRKNLEEVIARHFSTQAAIIDAAPGTELPVIDEEVFDEFLSALPESLAQSTLERVCSELTETVGDLDKTPTAELAAKAHKAAGAAAVVGAAKARDALAKLQDEAKAGEPNGETLVTAQDALRKAIQVLQEFSV